MAHPDGPHDDRARPSVFPGFAAIDRDVHHVVSHLAGHRRSRGLSQTEVAARMGTSQSAVARLEAGRGDLRLSTLQRYAAALDHTMHVGVAIDEEEGHAR